jgi:hypothetical protein
VVLHGLDVTVLQVRDEVGIHSFDFLAMSRQSTGVLPSAHGFV